MDGLGVHLEESKPDGNNHARGLEDDGNKDGDVRDKECPADKVDCDDGTDVRHKGGPRRESVHTDRVHYLDTSQEEDNHGHCHEQDRKDRSGHVGGFINHVVRGPAAQNGRSVVGVRPRTDPIYYGNGHDDPDDREENLDMSHTEYLTAFRWFFKHPHSVAGDSHDDQNLS